MAFDNIGSTGNSAIRLPSFVNSPRSFSAPKFKAYSSSKARMSVSPGGGSKNSNPIRSLISNDFNIRTTIPKLVLCISGTVLASNSFPNAHFVYNRKAFPGPTRLARPALWLAEAREHWGKKLKRDGNEKLEDTYWNHDKRWHSSSGVVSSAWQTQDLWRKPRHRS